MDVFTNMLLCLFACLFVYLVSLIRRTFAHIDQSIIKHVFTTIVRPHLEYAAPIIIIIIIIIIFRPQSRLLMSLFDASIPDPALLLLSLTWLNLCL